MKSLFAVFILLYGAASVMADPKPEEIYSTPCWLIPGAPGKITWIEIHNPTEAPVSGIAHIEVLTRKKGAHGGEIERVCPHLAITTEALCRSVTRPYKTLGLYPESYFSAYREWQAAEKQRTAPICSSSIQEFLKGR